MDGLKAVEDSRMTFTPTLEAFAANPAAASASLRGASKASETPAKTQVRYRAQGLDPDKRYRKPTRNQLQSPTLARPLETAHGHGPEKRGRRAF